MRLRICDGEFERILPATQQRLDEAFGPTSAAAPGMEITLTDGELWLSATVLALTEAAVYMMSGGRGMGVIVMGRTQWEIARRQFRDFLAREAPMRAVDQYVLRVLGDQWAAPARTPTLLDVSREGDGIAVELARVGFRVTRVTLDDSSLETVSERLASIHRHFDAVVVRDVLEAVDDWRNVVSRSVRRLRPGGVFVYGVSTGTRRPWLSRLLPRGLRRRRPPGGARRRAGATLRRSGLLQARAMSLAEDALDPSTTTYIGYSIMRGDPALATEMRWDFTGTGERWLAGARA